MTAQDLLFRLVRNMVQDQGLIMRMEPSRMVLKCCI